MDFTQASRAEDLLKALQKQLKEFIDKENDANGDMGVVQWFAIYDVESEIEDALATFEEMPAENEKA